MKQSKRILSLLLSLVLVLSLAGGLNPTHAASGAVITVAGGEQKGNEECLITLAVTLTGNPGFTYGTFRVRDSLGLLTLKSVETRLSGASAAVGRNNLFSVSTISAGSNVTADGVLAVLTLEASGTGTTTVSVELKNDDPEMLVNAAGQAVPVTFRSGAVTVSAAGSTDCLSVRESPVFSYETTSGDMAVIDLNSIFSDSAKHEVKYELLNAGRFSHATKVAGSSLYVSEKDAGVYQPIVRAVCAEGQTAEATFTVNVIAAPDGLPIQYDYDESPADSVTVFVTISSDGIPLMGNDTDSTILSHLEITVPYFDLAAYGLEDYYRLAADPTGSYIGDTVIHRPTAMHLFIYMIQRFYMGLPEAYCGPGGGDSVFYQGNPTNPQLSADEAFGVITMDGETAYDDNGTALSYTGGAQSTYMKMVWGHDENLMYYRNHAYPLQSPGWGSTADYILLSDGDTIDMAMFTNWNFYQYGSFVTFVDKDTRVSDGTPNGTHTDSCLRPETAFHAAVGETRTFSAVKFATQSVAEGGSDDFIPVEGDPYAEGLVVLVYDENWNDVTASDAIADWSDDGMGHYEVTFAREGTYYLLGIDPASGSSDACIAPATAKIIVTKPCITVESGSAAADESGLIPVTVWFDGNPGFASASLQLCYDASMLELRDVRANMAGVTARLGDRGLVELSTADGGDVTDSGALFTLYFKAHKNGTATVALNYLNGNDGKPDRTNLTNCDAEVVDVNFADGTIAIEGIEEVFDPQLREISGRENTYQITVAENIYVFLTGYQNEQMLFCMPIQLAEGSSGAKNTCELTVPQSTADCVKLLFVDEYWKPLGCASLRVSRGS